MKITEEYLEFPCDLKEKILKRTNTTKIKVEFIIGKNIVFENTTFYQETPFMEPYTTFDEIVSEWQHIKEQDIKNIEFKILAIDNNIIYCCGSNGGFSCNL
jgi:hypothetical protein